MPGRFAHRLAWWTIGQLAIAMDNPPTGISSTFVLQGAVITPCAQQPFALPLRNVAQFSTSSFPFIENHYQQLVSVHATMHESVHVLSGNPTVLATNRRFLSCCLAWTEPSDSMAHEGRRRSHFAKEWCDQLHAFHQSLVLAILLVDRWQQILFCIPWFCTMEGRR